MAGWYTYTGGWWNNATYSFQTGENGDVLYLPYNCQSFIRRGDNLYFTVDGGNLNLQLSDSDYIKYSFDGYNVYRAKFADYDANFTWYDPNVDFYGFYNDSGTLYVGEYGGADVRISDDLIRAKNLYAVFGQDNILFGNSLDNRIVDSYGNSQLWGGYGNNTLTGGEGHDTFFYEYDGGHDVITDADNGDTICLFNIMPWQNDVSCWYDGEDSIMYIFTPAGQLDVHCSNGTPWPALPVYQYSDGSRWQYIWNGVNSNDNWHQISYDAIEDTGADIAANPLWGNANEFFGTAQADNIFVSRTDGNDLVFDTDGADTVHLYDASLSDIVSTSVSDSSIAIEFNTGEVAQVSSSGNVSPTFKLASGQSYVYNRETSSWREA